MNIEKFLEIEKKYNSDLISDIYSYGFNDVHRTVKVYIFYEGTALTDYFTSADEASDEISDTLASYGIK